MKEIDISDAKELFLEIIESATRGEITTICSEGKAIARIIPIKKSRIGMLEGVYDVPDDIDTPFAQEIEAMFYGEAPNK